MKNIEFHDFLKIIKNVLLITTITAMTVLVGCKDDDTLPENNEELPKISTSNSARLFDGNLNMLTGGVISIDFTDSPTNQGINNLVDSNDSSFFATPRNSFNILWNGTRNVVVSHYTLTSASNRIMDPKNWVLSGSDNNTSWTQLDKQTNEFFSASKEKKEYYFKNKTAYKYYKLVIHSNNGGNATQIAEWTLQLKDDPSLPYSVAITDQNTNLPTAGSISSQFSDSPAGLNISFAVDAKINTKFVTFHNQFYIQWEGTKSATVNYYSLTSALDSLEKDPKSWNLSASNDLTQWTVIDSQSNQIFSNRGEKKEYFFSNKIAYRYYRLNILNNNGASSTQIAELTLRGLPTDITDLMSYSNGRTLSTQTTMGKKFENRHVTTDADRLWLSTASNEPALLNSASSLTQLKDFPVTLYPYGTPMPADVNQHAIGDCSAVAVLASFAYLYPDFIKAIITDNGNKTYTVEMFDPQGKPINVSVTSKFLADKNGKIGAVTGKSDKATWSTVLEKAIMKWQYIYKVNEDIGGIGTEHAAPLFTGDGDSFAFSANKLNSEQLYRAVGVSLNQGKIVIGGFKQGDIPVSGNHKTVSGHAFTLMYSLDKTALFSMRNPWGGEGDGVLNIPDNGIVPPLIDLRIVNAGKAANYAKGIPTPYTPPALTPAQNVMRVTDELLKSGR